MSSNNQQQFSKSQIQRDYIYSMLPREFQFYETQQIKKTKQFFKPQQFIWNNSHRTSKKFYQYYHKDNDNYKCRKEPLIRKLQQQDRQIKQRSRILNLSQKRQETRIKFWSKKLDRIQLESKTELKSNFQLNQTRFDRHISKLPHQSTNNNIGKLRQLLLKRSLSNPNMKSTIYKTKHKLTEYSLSSYEKSYLQSLQNFDKTKFNVANIIKRSKQQMKNNIYQSFLKQKTQNQNKQNILQPTLKKKTQLSKIFTKAIKVKNQSISKRY